MSDEHDAQERVRRLLGAASGPSEGEQVPAEVAARLDDVLAGLVAERGATADAGGTVPSVGDPDSGAGSGTRAPAGTVSDLAARRRRRWPRLLVAAAAVSVVGLGVGNLMQDGGGDAASSDQAAAGTAEERAEDAAGSAAEAGPEADVRSRRPDDDAGSTSALGTGDRPRLRTASLVLDVQRVEDLGLAMPVDESSVEWRDACVRPATGPGDTWLPVRLDGEPGVLVLRAPTGERRTGDVFACGAAGSPVASVTVDAR